MGVLQPTLNEHNEHNEHDCCFTTDTIQEVARIAGLALTDDMGRRRFTGHSLFKASVGLPLIQLQGRWVSPPPCANGKHVRIV
eukprot:1000295-Amphidinium_carterae.1